MSKDLLGKHEVLQVNGSKALARNKLCWDATEAITSQQKKQKRSPCAYSVPYVKKCGFLGCGSYHSPTTVIPSYLFVSSPLVSGPLSRAVLLRLSSVPCSVWKRGLVSDPVRAGPATQPSDTSWASEETAG